MNRKAMKQIRDFIKNVDDGTKKGQRIEVFLHLSSYQSETPNISVSTSHFLPVHWTKR
jgi:hypothetical protein